MELKEEATALMELIDVVTGNLAEKINRSDFEELDALIESRHILVNKLINLFSTSKLEKQILEDYLIDLQKRDKPIMDAVSQELETVRVSLLNLNNLKKYINV